MIANDNTPDLKKLAEQAAIRLMSDLKRGKITRINIDTIRLALLNAGVGKLTKHQRNVLESLTTRHVVELVG